MKNKMKKLTALLLALCTVGVMGMATACNSDDGTPEPEVPDTPEVPEEFAELNSYACSLTVGDTYQLSVLNTEETVILWSSENSSVATVDATGLVSAVGVGETEIVATVGEETLRCTVTVAQGMTDAVDFALNQEIANIFIGYTKQLSPRLVKGKTALDPAEYGLSYTSSNATVVSVTAAGLVKGEIAGTATITAKVTVDGEEYSDSIEVTVKSLNVISLDQDSIDLSVEGDMQSKTLSATYYEAKGDDFEEKENAAVAWSSSDESIVTVENGVCKAVGVGEATITAECEGVKNTCSVRVYSYYAMLYTAQDFLAMESHMDGYYELANDIDFANVTFSTIGDYTTAEVQANTVPEFTGYFDGNGYSVKNITQTGNHCKAIFSVLGAGGTLKNVAFEDMQFKATLNAGLALSAGVVWRNYGMIENVAVSMTTNATGTSVNEWGFGGVVADNRGTVRNCVVEMTDTSSSANTGAIFCVNRGGSVYNNVALVNSNISAYTHTGSFGSHYNNAVCKTVDDALAAVNNSSFSTTYWNIGRASLPTLKNAGKTVAVYNAERTLSSTDALTLNAELSGTLFTYDATGAKQTVAYTAANGATTIAASALPTLSAGYNDLYLLNGETLSIVRILGVTAYIGDANGVAAIANDMNGYYKLTANITLGAFNVPLGYTSSMNTDNAFNGVLDGCGYTITYNYTWTADMSNHNRCLIYSIGASGVVKNLGMTVGTDANNGVRRSALAYYNAGTVENVYADITFNNIGQTGENNGIAGLVYLNVGTIDNSVVKFTYAGTATINDYVGGICNKNQNGAITNTMLVAVVNDTTLGTVGTLSKANLNNGAVSAVGVMQNVNAYTSVSALNAALETLEYAGFTLGGVWSTDDATSGLKFGTVTLA